MPSSSRSTNAKPGPPRLLLGISLLFWGGMVGHPLIGLLVAIATEAAHWTRFRWDFGEHAFYRAWQASVLLLFFAGVLVWMNSSVVSALPQTVVWLPLLFFPLQFVQSYGMRATMPIATFSIFVRKRRDHARRHGLPFRDVQIAFGHIYFTLIIISSSLGTFAKTPIFFPCIVLLIVWAFKRQFTWRKRFAPLGAALVLGFSVLGGYTGVTVIDMIYHKLIGLDQHNGAFARETHTSIGKLKELKQSPNIIWRVKPLQGSLPRHLRIASYNNYLNATWRAEVPPDDEGTRIIQDFEELPFIGVENPYRIVGREANGEFLSGDIASASYLPRFILRGAIQPEELLPIPSNAASLVIPAQNLEINTLGSLRIDPKHPVANATVLWKRNISTSKAPWETMKVSGLKCPDLGTPKHETETLAEVARELNLHQGTLDEKVTRIRNHFLDQFTYTRYLDRPDPSSKFDPDQFISIFLTETRRGHCEYFATATALLLREVGVPTRYATGFAVVEVDPKSREAIIRGTHAHAWCEAWDEVNKRWVDVDLTPPDWTGLETPRTPPWQDLLDRWQILRDDILVWRSEPGNLAIAFVIITLPLLFGGFLVSRRLWKSKRRIDPAAERRVANTAHPKTALSGIEKAASIHLGPRPPGMPLGSWLVGLSSVISEPARLHEAIALHRAIRFDPSADSTPLSERLEALAAELRQELKS
ncbi:transglutaminase family protein [Haloferula chungangensis]|uniref:Transglutaminase family protein n=1 Tax=Haloferula chungangensis TaxID=1048331 RepID=A0ABW2LCE2_9BACT